LFFFTNQELPVVREQYFSASKSKEDAEKFYVLMSKYNKENKVFLAYKGAATALKSKFTTDKKLKRSLFVDGVAMVENAVKSESNNAEIRLIRLSIQENTPKILKYKSNIDEDKMLILNVFDKQNAALKEYIKLYVKQSKIFSEKEKQTLLK
jgi:hypothetical protein